MAYYLVQAAYTTEACKALVKNPQDRTEVVKKSVEKLGGKLEGAWFAFGDYDIILILQLPDNVAATALALAIGAGGALKAQKTTPLMTIAEGVQAMKKASSTDYRPPS
jgi:uncharacterized protein with GYD domain